jgi:hypothetical protein
VKEMERECVIKIIEVLDVNEKGEITNIEVFEGTPKKILPNVKRAIKVDPSLPHDPKNEAVEIIKRLNEEYTSTVRKWEKGDHTWLLCEKE